jgi:hypothetical protein
MIVICQTFYFIARLGHWVKLNNTWFFFFFFTSKIIVKGVTQINGHFLKLHFCMFEISQGKHNSWDFHNFWNIFH